MSHEQPESSPRMPRDLSEGMIEAFCEDEPQAVDWVCARVLPGETAPRRVLDRAGLPAFEAWTLRTSPLTAVEQQVVLAGMWRLSADAGLLLSPDRVRELTLAHALRTALDTEADASGALSNEDALAGSMEFFIQVLVEAHVAEAAQTDADPTSQEHWARIAARLDDLTGAIAQSVLRRLRQRWQP